MAKKIEIKAKFKGLGVYTTPPTAWERKEGGKFILDDKLTQRELRYLYDAIGLKSYFFEIEEEKPVKKNKKSNLGS